MFAGLASPSHPIIVLVLVLLLFGAKRVPELTKGLRTGIKELREGISTGDAAEAAAPGREEVRGEDTLARSEVETVGTDAGQRGR